MAKTVEQIASDLNLSVTTVRLVLNGKAEQYRISVKTQTRINEYVERYGYIINHSARSLKLNKTDTLGLIVPNISNVFLLRWQKNSNNAVDVPDINLQSVALMMMLTMKIN